jgi:catechol 2,3-dioxygenase-like lactoylglutathione lyase family enzyme
MRIIKLAWVGTRTDNAEPTVAFFRDVLGLRLELDRPGFWMLKLPDGSKVEVFGPDSEINRHFTTGPVAGFLVDDVPPRRPSCGPPGWRSSWNPGSTTAATPGSTSAPRTATSMSSPRTLASPDHTSAALEPSRGSNPKW